MVSSEMQNSVNPLERSIVDDVGVTNVLYVLVKSVRRNSYRYTQKFHSNNNAYYHMYLHMILTPLFGWIADGWIGSYSPQYVSKYFGIHNS